MTVDVDDQMLTARRDRNWLALRTAGADGFVHTQIPTLNFGEQRMQRLAHHHADLVWRGVANLGVTNRNA